MAAPPRIHLRPGVSEPVILMISRREVEAADLASVLSRLKVFLATREDRAGSVRLNTRQPEISGLAAV